VPSRVAVRRVVVRLLAVAGFAACAWIVGVLLTSASASADTGPTGRSTTDSSTSGKSTAGSGSRAGSEGLGGLVGGLLNTVGGTVQTVTTTVTSTVNTTVTNTVGLVANTVTTVTKTVDNVVHTATELPQHVLSGGGGDDGGLLSPLLHENPVTSGLLKPKSSSKTTAEQVRVDAPAVVVAAPETAPGEAAPVEAAPVVAPQDVRTHAVRSVVENVTRATGSAAEHAAPAGRGAPGPLPGPGRPVAPAAPCPGFSAGNDGGAGARGVLAAVLSSQTPFAAPPLAGRLGRDRPVAERGHTPGLPVTSPD
jgi:hypothetical protein